MTFICGNCAKEYASFWDVLGCFLKHIDEGIKVKDWVEIPRSLLDKPTAEV